MLYYRNHLKNFLLQRIILDGNGKRNNNIVRLIWTALERCYIMTFEKQTYVAPACSVVTFEAEEDVNTISKNKSFGEDVFQEDNSFDEEVE